MTVCVTGLTLPACSTNDAASADQFHAPDTVVRISAGMSRLGASAERSNCYAGKIASALSGPEAIEAVQIIESSTSKDDMRNGVLNASAPVKQSFIRAHFGCSLL